jgi:ParB/RepB/Spo0J family partition protein
MSVGTSKAKAAKKANILESIGVGPGAPAAGDKAARKAGKAIVAELDAASDPWAGVASSKQVLREIPLGKIVGDRQQPRTEFDAEALDELAASMRSVGQLQPCDVSWDPSLKKYVIIFGERRLRAASIAGLKTLRCVIHDPRPDADKLRMVQIVENLQRADLGPIEEARAFESTLLATSWSQAELARRIGCSEARVSKAIALVRKLPPEVQAWVADGSLPAGHAYEISRMENSGEKIEVAMAAIRHHSSRSEVEKSVAWRLEREVREAQQAREREARSAEIKEDREHERALRDEAAKEAMRRRPDPGDDDDDDDDPGPRIGGLLDRAPSPPTLSPGKPWTPPPPPVLIGGWLPRKDWGRSVDFSLDLPDADGEPSEFGLAINLPAGSEWADAIKVLETALAGAKACRAFAMVPGGAKPGDRVTLCDPDHPFHAGKGTLLDRCPDGIDYLWVAWEDHGDYPAETRAHPAGKLRHLDPLLIEVADEAEPDGGTAA